MHGATMPTAPAPTTAIDRVRDALIVVVVLAVASVVVLPAEALPERPLTEDAFYALAVSRNLALGAGPTIDGTHLTNGFQPLFTLICALPYLLFDGRLAPLRGVLAISWMVWLATGWTVGGIAARLSPDPERARRWGLLLWLGAGHLYFAHFNGLETGLLLLGHALVARGVLDGGLDRLRGAAGLGALAGLTVLARIDAALLVAGLVVAEVALGAGTTRDRLGRAVMFGAVAVAVSSPWWIYNAVAFGSVMPTSGTAQQAWGLEAYRLVEAGRATLMATVPWASLPGSGHTGGLAWGAARAVAALALLWATIHRSGREAVDATDVAPGLRLYGVGAAVAVLGMLAYYALGSYAVWHYPRYLAPFALPAVVWAALWVTQRPPSLRLAAALLAPALTLAAVTDLWTARAASQSMFWQHQIPLVETHVPDGTVVASWQSGTLGYLRDDVVNLDGKVNPDALDRKDDLPAYLDEQGIGWLVDWPANVAIGLGLAHDGDVSTLGWKTVATDGPFTLYRRADAE